MADVELSGLTKRFGDVVAVEAMDLTIANGELMVFVGPSGCGKSTTLRMIAGLEASSDGIVRIGGRDVTNLAPKERNVAMVFQNYALYAHKNVYANLAFGLKVRGTPSAEIERRVKAAAEMLGIEELLHRKPKQLSGGQKQRVALGRAMVRDPDVFLLDEPLSNLDAKMRVRMREEIGRIHRTIGTSMVYVTHDQVEAMTLGDRIVVMKDGRVQQVGPPLELYDRPTNRFVAGFIGSPEMNVLEGALSDDGAEIALNGVSLPLGGGANGHGGRRIALGIRPEHLAIADGETAEADRLPVEIDLVEQMGAQTFMVCRGPCGELRALVARNDDVRRGERLNLRVGSGSLHVFDAETGVALLSRKVA